MSKSSGWCFPLGEPFSCGCGRTHRLELRELIVGDGVLKELPALCRRVEVSGTGLIFADPNTWAAAGERAEALMKGAGLPVHTHLFRRDHVLHPDDEAFAEGQKVIAEHKPDYLIAVGSGSINDLTKWLSSEAKLPYLTVATAPSMDGYGSPGAAILRGGVKLSVQCGAARGVLADFSILGQAPPRMLASGFADLMGKYTCNADWYLAQELADEYRCEAAWDAIRANLAPCLEGALNGTLATGAALETLTQGLISSGLAMLLVENSRPAGGCEHLISHTWEMRALQQGKECDFHGIMVGVGAVYCARLYKQLLELEPEFFQQVAEGEMPADLPVNEDAVRAVYGRVADSVLAEAVVKALTPEKWRARMQKAARRWPELRVRVAEMIAPTEYLREAFAKVGAPTTPEEVGVSREELRLALLHSRHMRRRYTGLDLMAELGVLARFVDRAVASK